MVQMLQDAAYIISGAFICGFALNSFLIPNNFLDGGITGISLLVHELYHVNIAALIVLFNIPFILVGAFQMSGSFAIRSFAGILLISICLGFIPYPVFHYDRLVISVFGGVFLGLGIGLGMRGGCAFDGLEVLAAYTLKRTSFTISEIILAFNVVIFLIAALRLGFEIALYAILTYYVVSRTINYVVEGLEEFTGVTIISGKSEAIKSTLAKEMGRGITVYKGERGFLKDSFEISQPCDIVFTIISRLEVRKLKNVVINIDPNAFIYTHTIKEAANGILKRKIKHG